MNKLSYALVAVGASILMGVTAQAANLVQNPDFNTNTSWTLHGPGSFTYDSTNGQPQPSALVTAPDNSTPVEVDSDCIAITAQNVDLYADIQVHAGSGGVGVNAFNAANCTDSLGNAGNTSGTPPFGTWGTESHLNFALLPGTQSVIVYLSTNPAGGDSPSSLSFDNIRFGPVNTTPVQLQSFKVN